MYLYQLTPELSGNPAVCLPVGKSGTRYGAKAFAHPRHPTMLTVWVRRTPRHAFCQGVFLCCFSSSLFAFCSCLFIFCFRPLSLSFLPLSPIAHLLFPLSLIFSPRAPFSATPCGRAEQPGSAARLQRLRWPRSRIRAGKAAAPRRMEGSSARMASPSPSTNECKEPVPQPL